MLPSLKVMIYHVQEITCSVLLISHESCSMVFHQIFTKSRTATGKREVVLTPFYVFSI